MNRRRLLTGDGAEREARLLLAALLPRGSTTRRRAPPRRAAIGRAARVHSPASAGVLHQNPTARTHTRERAQDLWNKFNF